MKETGFVKAPRRNFISRIYRYIGTNLPEYGKIQQLRFEMYPESDRVVFDAPMVDRDGSVRKRSGSYPIVVAIFDKKEMFRTRLMESSTSTTVLISKNGKD